MHYKTIKIYPNISLRISEKGKITTILKYAHKTTILDKYIPIDQHERRRRRRVYSRYYTDYLKFREIDYKKGILRV